MMGLQVREMSPSEGCCIQWPNADGSCSHCSPTGFAACQPLPRSPALHYCGLTRGRIFKKPAGDKCQNARLHLTMHSDRLLPLRIPCRTWTGGRAVPREFLLSQLDGKMSVLL